MASHSFRLTTPSPHPPSPSSWATPAESMHLFAGRASSCLGIEACSWICTSHGGGWRKGEIQGRTDALTNHRVEKSRCDLRKDTHAGQAETPGVTRHIHTVTWRDLSCLSV